MLKKLGLSVLALFASVGIAIAAGAFDGFPVVGDTTGQTTCLSYGNNNVCNQWSPAGPANIPAGSQIPADTQSNGQPFTVKIPFTSLGGGNIAVNTTTGVGQNPVVAAGVSNHIYAGAGTATYATFTLPATPTQNQSFCLVNAGSGVLTLTSIVVGTVGQQIVGVAPTSLPVMTAVGTAGTVTLGTNCWIYNQPNVTWYRVQ